MSKVQGRRRPQSISPSDQSESRFIDLIERFPSTKILVIGDFILDEFVWGSVERISPEAPVPVVNVERESYVPGGALNVANNVRTLGGQVIPCGVVGRDLHGRMLVKAMRREGIEIRGVIYDGERPTTRKTRVVAHSQQVVRFDREKALEMDATLIRRMAQFIKKTMRSVDVVVIEDYGKGVINPTLLSSVLKDAKDMGKRIVVDPKQQHFSYYRGASVITPNRKEALSIFGARENGKLPSIEEAGRGLLKELEVDAVLITLGEEGMALFEKGGATTKIPTAARQIYDVSGAGDTVAAVFALALGVGATTKEAATLANFAAGIVVGKIGTATVLKRELKAVVSQISHSKKQAGKRQGREAHSEPFASARVQHV